MEKNVRLERLKCTFPKLTEANQHYILGIAAGLKYVQKKITEEPEMKGRLRQCLGW